MTSFRKCIRVRGFVSLALRAQESLNKVLAIAEEQALLVGESVIDFAKELDVPRLRDY